MPSAYLVDGRTFWKRPLGGVALRCHSDEQEDCCRAECKPMQQDDLMALRKEDEGFVDFHPEARSQALAKMYAGKLELIMSTTFILFIFYSPSR